MELPIRPLAREDLDHVLERAAPAWRTLRGARLFISGGTGFFGIWLLESLAAANARLGAGIQVTVLSRAPARFAARAPHLASACAWLAGDVRDFAFPSGEWTHFVHGAASTSAAASAREAEMLATIHGGTERMLELAAHSRATSFLFVSSGAVYGRQPAEIEKIPETFEGRPQGAYAQGKRHAETLCTEAARRGMAVKIARCFAFVGPHLPLDAHFAAGNFLRDALAGRGIAVEGDGSPDRSYLHPADLVVWLLTILARGQSPRAYNVGSDEAVSIAELAERVAALPAKPVPVTVRKTAGKGPAERYVPSIERARKELGLEVGIRLEAALRRTYGWLRGAGA